MHCSSRSPNHSLIQRVGFALALLSTSVIAPKITAQNTPVLSGGAAFFSNTSGGDTGYQMVVSPLIAVPLGPRLFVEGRGILVESVSPTQNGYNTSRFFGLSYIDANLIVNKHVTLAGGEFLTPFGTFNERLTPIWINNFQDVPLIYGLGTMNSGSSLGGMVRGNLFSTDEVSVSYTAYVSAGSTNSKLNAQRAAGGQTSFYFPKARLEVGASYGHRLETIREDYVGAHVWWEPAKIPLKLRTEYAHGPNSQGYWIEAASRLPKFRDIKWLEGFEPVTRIQQTFRNAPDNTDNLPAVDTQRVDFGMNYHLPHEVRINTSYARQFASNGNFNVWETGIVYRFLTPVWKGR